MYPQCLTVDEVEQLTAEAWAELPLAVSVALLDEGWCVRIRDGEPDEAFAESLRDNHWYAICDRRRKEIWMNTPTISKLSWCWREEEARDRIKRLVFHEVWHALGKQGHDEMCGVGLMPSEFPPLAGHTEGTGMI